MLARQESRATTLAQSIGGYVGLHRAALAALAGQPGLTSLSVDAQREVLRATARAYPDFFVLTTYDANGAPIARGDELRLMPAAGHAVFDDARQTNVPSMEMLTWPAVDRPLFAFGAPIRGPTGDFAGLVGGGLEPERLAAVLARAGAAENVQAYLVDGLGRLIAHPDAPLAAGFPDWSAWPPVAMLLRRLDSGGSLSYTGPSGEQFAGYAHIPELGWGVIVERSAAASLATVRTGRDLAFGVLLLVIALGAIVGALAATRLAAPLAALARATEGLAAGNVAAPLPRSQVSEVARLAQAFGEMRDRLARRTAQRERAEQAQSFLAEAGTLLAGSLDYETTLQSVARAAVPYLADLCAFDVIDDDGTIRRVAVAHADPRKQEIAQGLLHYPPQADGISNAMAVLRDGRPRVMLDVDDAYVQGIARDAEHLRILKALELKSLTVVPLLIRDRVFGSLLLVTTESRRVYRETDLALAEELARRAAVAVENARLYGEAQAAVRARDEFLSIASHELRTPIAGIKGQAQLLGRVQQRGRLDAERLDRSVGLIVAAADRLATLTHDLLDVSRIRLGQLPLRPRPLDLAALVDALASQFREQLDEHHTLVLDPAGPCPVDADPDRLEQVLMNLLDNAVKYSPDGGAIRVSLGQDNGSVVLSVRDDGIGLPADTVDAIFQPFGRAANATREHLPGMGLGLYICRDIVERHGGRIWAVSGGQGLGTTMYVRLPLGEVAMIAADAVQPTWATPRSAPTPPSAPGSTKRTGSLTPLAPAADDSECG